VTDEQRFLAKIERIGDCWLWRGWLCSGGYRAALAARFGVSVPTIEAVVRGYNWSHV